MYSTTSILSFVAPFVGFAIATVGPPVVPDPAPTLKWAALGDSWASGINYYVRPPGKSVDWDGDKNAERACRRSTEAYAAQMSNATDWTNGVKQSFAFPACSGSTTAGMLPQAQQMGDARFVTLTLGGNDAGFFKVVDSCVYQSVREFNFYGPDYPDPAGRCWQSIDEAQSNINGTHVNHVLREQMNEAIKAIIDEAHDVDKEKAFDVFLTGYALPFNSVDPYCDTQSFGAYWFRKPKLTTQLRQVINQLAQDINSLYASVVADKKDSSVHFVNITEGFEKHRFCEPGMTDFYETNDELWVYNFDWPWLKDSEVSNFTLPLFDFANQATFPDLPGLLALDAALGGWSKNDGDPGELLRPFHPKPSGHNSIKTDLIKAIQDAGIVGSKDVLANLINGFTQSNGTGQNVTGGTISASSMNTLAVRRSEPTTWNLASIWGHTAKHGHSSSSSNSTTSSHTLKGTHVPTERAHGTGTRHVHGTGTRPTAANWGSSASSLKTHAVPRSEPTTWNLASDWGRTGEHSHTSSSSGHTASSHTKGTHMSTKAIHGTGTKPTAASWGLSVSSWKTVAKETRHSKTWNMAGIWDHATEHSHTSPGADSKTWDMGGDWGHTAKHSHTSSHPSSHTLIGSHHGTDPAHSHGTGPAGASRTHHASSWETVVEPTQNSVTWHLESKWGYAPPSTGTSASPSKATGWMA